VLRNCQLAAAAGLAYRPIMTKHVLLPMVVLATACHSVDLVKPTELVTSAILRIKTDDQTIRVPGTAKRRVRSDFVLWRVRVTVARAELSDVYRLLATNFGKVRDYLRRRGIAATDISSATVESEERYKSVQRAHGKPEWVRFFQVSQLMEVKSKNVALVSTVAGDAAQIYVSAGLNEPGVRFDSQAPSYYFSRMEELKVDVIAEATRHAKQRASQIASAGGGKLGRLLSAQVGDVAIASPYAGTTSSSQPSTSEEFSSIEKDVIANVTLLFMLQ
jgi:uncharacterized protein